MRQGTPGGLRGPRDPRARRSISWTSLLRCKASKKSNPFCPIRWGSGKMVVFLASGKQTKKSREKLQFFLGFFVCFPPDALASGSAAKAARPETAATSQYVAVPSRFSGKQTGFFTQAAFAGWCPEAHGLWRRSLRAAQALIPFPWLRRRTQAG